MGRYANFYNTPKKGHFEYKFWFGVQDSVIPWTTDKTTHYVEEYDEDKANEYEFTEEQRQAWKDNAEDELDSLQGFSSDVRDALEMVSCENYSAEDDDGNLEEYWAEVHAMIKKLDLPEFVYNPDVDLETQIDAYENHLTDIFNKLQDKQEEEKKIAKTELKVQGKMTGALANGVCGADALADFWAQEDYLTQHFTTREKMKFLADLHLKLVICCFLQKYGSYLCHFEV